jgi:predicted TPR repeat methyltransferase
MSIIDPRYEPKLGIGERGLTLTPDQAFKFAIERHQCGELSDALVIYEALIARWPEHPDVLSHLGILQHQRGNSEKAAELLQRAVSISDVSPGAWNNLGIVLLSLKRHDEAEDAFRRSIALSETAEAESNLSRVLRHHGQWLDSEAACRRALMIAPDFGDAWHNLSLALLGLGRIAEGIQAANKALILLPAHKRHRDSYARALVIAGEIDKAAYIFKDWLAEEPDNPYVQHHLAACTGSNAPDRASDAYVEYVFDNFASTFDRKLARLRYRAPEIVSNALRRLLPAPAKQFAIADLGCGTGLCGPLVREWARCLEGCDLSAAMLEQARRRGVYDVLQHTELVTFLNENEQQFDVVVSADTLCYFGELLVVAKAAHRSLRLGGHLVFTVEALDDAAASSDRGRHGYQLLASGRYAHACDYLKAAVNAAGLQLQSIAAEDLRDEAGIPVKGWLVVATRAPG